MPKKPDLIEKIDASGLLGRGGAMFPVALKWRNFQASLKSKKLAYIVINAAEGEPGSRKDLHILVHEAETMLLGVKAALDFFGPSRISKVYLFAGQAYLKSSAKIIKTILEKKEFKSLRQRLEFFMKPDSQFYINGEETTIVNIISGRRPEPSLRPPFPSDKGINNAPTLIHNVETFWAVGLIAAGDYNNQRLYTIEGAVKHPGVYILPESFSVAEVLHKTSNYPLQPFFVQVGGNVSGEVLASSQLDQPASGAASIMVYDALSTNPNKLIEYWLRFYAEQSCGQCTVCREGSMRLLDLLRAGKRHSTEFGDILVALEESSFCALGSSIPIPLKTYFKNILHHKK